MNNAAGPFTDLHAVGRLKKGSAVCLVYTCNILHAHMADPVNMYIRMNILQVLFINAYATGPLLHMHTIQALFIHTRLPAQFTLYISRSLITSTHIRRCHEYTHAAAHCTYANRNVALHISTLAAANAIEPTRTYLKWPIS